MLSATFCSWKFPTTILSLLSIGVASSYRLRSNNPTIVEMHADCDRLHSLRDRIGNFHRKLYDVCATLLFCLLDPCAASLLQSDEQAPNSSSTTRQQVAARGRRPAINADVLPCSCQLGMQEVEVWEITTCSLPTAVSAGVEGGKQRGKKARSDINRCHG